MHRIAAGVGACALIAQPLSRAIHQGLARYGTEDGFLQRIVPRLSQEALAEIVGTTRGRVNSIMNKFSEAGLSRLQRRDQGQAGALQRRASFVKTVTSYLSSLASERFDRLHPTEERRQRRDRLAHFFCHSTTPVFCGHS